MKNLIIILVLVIGSAAGYTAHAQGKKAATVETVVYDVNLNCDKCKAKLEKHIPFEKGVKDMNVDVAGKKVIVTFYPRKNSTEEIARAIEKLGYTCTVAVPKE